MFRGKTFRHVVVHGRVGGGRGAVGAATGVSIMSDEAVGPRSLTRLWPAPLLALAAALAALRADPHRTREGAGDVSGVLLLPELWQPDETAADLGRYFDVEV